MPGDERSRLHEIVDRLPESELELACQLLELLEHGSAPLRADITGGALSEPSRDTGNGAGDGVDDPETSPETLARLGQLTDEELLRLDELLESDRDEARRFWRERFGEDLTDEL